MSKKTIKWDGDTNGRDVTVRTRFQTWALIAESDPIRSHFIRQIWTSFDIQQRFNWFNTGHLHSILSSIHCGYYQLQRKTSCRITCLIHYWTSTEWIQIEAFHRAYPSRAGHVQHVVASITRGQEGQNLRGRKSGPWGSMFTCISIAHKYKLWQCMSNARNLEEKSPKQEWSPILAFV